MDTSKITIMNEEFVNDKSGEKVQGVTIIIDGTLKQVCDLLIEKTVDCNTYIDIMHHVLLKGIHCMMEDTHQHEKHKL